MKLTIRLSSGTRHWLARLFYAVFGNPRQPKTFIGSLRLADGTTVKGEIMATQIRDDGSATAAVAAKDAKGNPAQVENPAWASSDEKLFTVEPSADGMTCKVVPVGGLGSGQLQFKCDAQIGDGVTELSGQADIEIVSGQAATVEISLSTDK